MCDISSWLFLGYGEMSTLKKEDLVSPDNKKYVMKYPRPFDGNRINWEDVNEVIAARIAKLLGLSTVEAEIAYRKGKRGCLMLHFIDQYKVDYGETGASLLSAELGIKYDKLKNSELKNLELVKKSFSVMESFSYFSTIKFDFIAMNIFDILIGNQDRHPFNWQVLFKNGQSFFGPLYDNGASLGWQHSDVQLKEMLDNQYSLNRYFKGMKVKAGILENTQPPLRATQVLSYCITNYPSELRRVMELLKQFDVDAFYDYIDTFPLISGIRKTFLKKLINFRIEKILSICIKER